MRLSIAVLLLATAAGPAHAARPLTELLGRVPAPPTTAVAAAAWLDADGEVIEPRHARLAADLKAEQQAGTDAAMQTGAQMAAGAGAPIDQSRLSDPAYQQELQQRYASMTPDQMMAMAAQSQASMAQDAMRMAQEPPEVLAAFQGYQDLFAADAAAGANHYSVAEQQAMASIAARFDPQQSALDRELQDCNECDAAGVARAQASNKVVWKKKLALADQELGAWSAFFVKARAARAGLIAKGHAQLAAAGYGAKAKSTNFRQNLTSYHLMLLGRIEELMKVPAEAARRAGRVALRAKVEGGP